MGIKEFYTKYKEYILFNKNIIISGICAFFAGAIFTQIYSLFDKSSFNNSLVTLTFEYAVYLPIFGYLYYTDNKTRYSDKISGKIDSRKVLRDFKKLVVAFAISEIIYSISKIIFHYQLLIIGILEPYQASMIGSLIAWAIFLVIINISVKAVNLFRSK